MKRTLLALVVALAGAVLLPACSDDGGTASPAPVDDADVVAVTVSSNRFTPETVQVKVGQTVRWTWQSGSHDVKSGTSCTADGTFDSGDPQVSGVFERKFEAAGTFPYFCTPHCQMGMTGTVVVTE